jgi:putative Ca2+/H+ antiporter (TMEM165/GDT1 family)
MLHNLQRWQMALTIIIALLIGLRAVTALSALLTQIPALFLPACLLLVLTALTVIMTANAIPAPRSEPSYPSSAAVMTNTP